MSKVKALIQKLVDTGYLKIVDDYILGTTKANKVMGLPIPLDLAKPPEEKKVEQKDEPKKSAPKKTSSTALPPKLEKEPMKLLLEKGKEKNQIPYRVEWYDSSSGETVRTSVGVFSKKANQQLAKQVKAWHKELGVDDTKRMFTALVRVCCLFYSKGESKMTVGNYLLEERWQGDIDEMFRILKIEDNEERKTEFASFVQERYG